MGFFQILFLLLGCLSLLYYLLCGVFFSFSRSILYFWALAGFVFLGLFILSRYFSQNFGVRLLICIFFGLFSAVLLLFLLFCGKVFFAARGAKKAAGAILVLGARRYRDEKCTLMDARAKMAYESLAAVHLMKKTKYG